MRLGYIGICCSNKIIFIAYIYSCCCSWSGSIQLLRIFGRPDWAHTKIGTAREKAQALHVKRHRHHTWKGTGEKTQALHVKRHRLCTWKRHRHHTWKDTTCEKAQAPHVKRHHMWKGTTHEKALWYYMCVVALHEYKTSVVVLTFWLLISKDGTIS